MPIQLGMFGAWQPARTWTADLARTVERAGYGTVWVGTSPPGDLRHVESLLDATATIVVGTSIVNIWKDEPAVLAASFHRVESRHPGRVLIGIGSGHPERTPGHAEPHARLVAYLDELQRRGVPSDRLALAALGPRRLGLAARRTAGALPYLTTPAHTARARTIMGDRPILAPELKVVLVDDVAQGREVGRARIRDPYLRLDNYRRSLLALGYHEADLADGGSDRLVDDLAPHGTAEQVGDAIRSHLDAGANHVAVQVLAPGGASPASGYRALGRSLSLTGFPDQTLENE